MFPAGQGVDKSAPADSSLAPESIHNELDLWANLQFTFDMDDEGNTPSKKGSQRNVRRRSAGAVQNEYNTGHGDPSQQVRLVEQHLNP
jgi:hypothetical protein